MTGKARRFDLQVLILAWLAFSLRVFGLDFQSLWRDEVDALRFATRALPQLLETFRTPGENGPLYFLALRFWLAAGGRSEFSLRFPSVWVGTVAVLVIFVLVRRLAGRRPALIAALLAATAPYLIWYGQEAKMYAALTLLAPLSLWLTVEACQRGGWWRWLLLYAVTVLCFYTHLLAALVAAVQVLWLLILPSWGRPARRWLIAAGYLAALFLPYLPLFRWQAGMWLSPFETGHPFVPLGDILAVLAVAFSQGLLQAKTPIALLPAILALVAGIGLCATGSAAQRGASGGSTESEWSTLPPSVGGWRVVAMLSVWLFLPPLAVYGVSLGMPIFTDRYLIWCMPAFLALASLGIVALARAWRPLGAVVLAAMLVVNGAGLWAQRSQPIKSDFRAAARFVLAHRQPGDLLLFQIPYSRYPFSYYSNGGVPEELSARGDLPWMEGPFTNNGASEVVIAEQMARGTAGRRAVWLIASEVVLWDQRELTRAWLSSNGQVTDQADFTRVSVARFELGK
jgi:4-amino-4-deoxy-L-arabinose transferase-like glycosyltransferase